MDSSQLKVTPKKNIRLYHMDGSYKSQLRKPRLYDLEGAIFFSHFLVLKLMTDLEREFNKNAPRDFLVRAFSFARGSRYYKNFYGILSYLDDLLESKKGKKDKTANGKKPSSYNKN